MTRPLVLGSLAVFVLAWSGLAALAMWSAPPPASAGELQARRLTAEEIARHDRLEDCWIVIRGKVYDVTSYIDVHPAPRRTITDHCGEESTWAFETKERERAHSQEAWELLDRYLVGEAIE